MRRIICKSVNNLRDLGGYMTEDMKITKFNCIYRSDVPTFFTESELDFFKKNNLIIIEFETGRSIDTKVKKINVEENSLIVTIKQKEKYGIFTSEAFRWVIMIEVPKESTQGVTELVVNFKK